MLLYKYKDISNSNIREYTADSLKNKYLYFSRPSELNDPFDCQIQIEIESNKTEFESWKNRNLDRIPPNNRLLTFEGKNQTVNESRTQNGLELVRQRLVEKNHLLSLTPDCLNESMWALYAGNYNGICIGYNTDPNFNSFIPKKIEFTSEFGSSLILTDNILIKFEPIQYDNEGNHPLKIFTSNQTEQIEAVSYNLTHKKKCWLSENEYRAIIHDTDFNIHSIENKTVKVFYEDSLLEEIIFGNLVKPEIAEMIMQIIQTNYSNNVRFYRVRVDLKKYCLVKEKI